jgi:hypothetical protein
MDQPQQPGVEHQLADEHHHADRLGWHPTQGEQRDGGTRRVWKDREKTMLTGPESRSMANTCGPCDPISFWLSDSADSVSVPMPKANKKALNAEASAKTTTMTLPFCGCRTHKASTNISAGIMGKNPSKTDKTASKKMVLGSEPWRKSAVSTL